MDESAFTFTPPTEEEQARNLRSNLLYHVQNKDRPVEQVIEDAKALYRFVTTGE